VARTIDSALRSALATLLKPLVRVLLRNGISHRVFSDIAKHVYVDVASRDPDFAISGRKQTTSRIAVLTGINRKEVARLQSADSPIDVNAPQHFNRAIRVISAWTTDTRFLSRGRPASLELEGRNSFSELVRDYSGDMPVQAVLAELLRVGAVQRLRNGKLRLTRRAYVPSGEPEEKIQILGDDVRNLISTIDHNLENDADLRFQREVSYDEFPLESIEEFKAMSAERSQALLEQHYTWLKERAGKTSGDDRRRVGVGIYYFEISDEDQS
jgi:hypothetical protein